MIAVIPARSGSKGLPGKNIKILNGKPLIAYTIEAAKMAKSVDMIFLSTDSEEIKAIGEKYGAFCPLLRPSHLASDDSLAIDTYKYTVDMLECKFNKLVDSFIVLQPTSPLRTSNDIDSANKLFVEKKADSVMSYTEEDHPIFWHKYLDKEQKLKNIFPESIKNRQDYQKTYYPNGSIFVFSKKTIFQDKYYTDNSYAYIMPKERSVDIDTEIDFKFAEFLMRNDERYK